MTTRTVAWALTWEYWRRGAIWLVPAVAGLVIACTGSLYGLILHVTRLHYSDLRAELDVGLLAFVMLPPVVLTVASFASSGRYHVLPIPTALFVGCTLANGALAAMLTYGLVAPRARPLAGCRLAVARPRLLGSHCLRRAAVAGVAGRPLARATHRRDGSVPGVRHAAGGRILAALPADARRPGRAERTQSGFGNAPRDGFGLGAGVFPGGQRGSS